MDSLAKLVARAEIEDCLKQYARGVDRRDWALVRNAFHDDAIDHHGEFHGTGDAFIEWVRDRHAQIPFSMHYLLNCLIEFRSSTQADAETYFWALQRRDGPTGGTDYEVFGRYVDVFEQRNGVWRIAGRRVAYDSTRTQASTNHKRELVGILGRRDSSDPVFHPQQAAE